MWERYYYNLEQKELANRPKYFEKFDDAAQIHIEPYHDDLASKTLDEQQIKESFWRKALEVSDFRDAIKESLKENENADL